MAFALCAPLYHCVLDLMLLLQYYGLSCMYVCMYVVTGIRLKYDDISTVKKSLSHITMLSSLMYVLIQSQNYLKQAPKSVSQ